jgi:hypothetical protein
MTRYSPEARAGRIELAAAAKADRAEALTSEIEFLVMCGEGEGEILRKTSYHGKPEALKRQLHRIGRPDLIPRIFEHEQMNLERLGKI